MDKIDRLFIEQFKTKNGSIKEPTESMMLPTDALTELDNILKKNSTYCFRVDEGVAGWCATCKVGLIIFFLVLSHIIERKQLFLRLEQKKESLDFVIWVEMTKIGNREIQRKWPWLPRLQ